MNLRQSIQMMFLSMQLALNRRKQPILQEVPTNLPWVFRETKLLSVLWLTLNFLCCLKLKNSFLLLTWIWMELKSFKSVLSLNQNSDIFSEEKTQDRHNFQSKEKALSSHFFAQEVHLQNYKDTSIWGSEERIYREDQLVVGGSRMAS